MRIVVHDFAGHPFQVQLSRELAANGHSVAHVYLKDLPGPKGPLQRSPGDAPSFRAVPLTLGAPLDKYSMWKRHFAHRRYARALTAFIERERPDVFLSANTPIDVQDHVRGECRRRGIAFVHWMQDLYCMAVRSVLAKKLGSVGGLLARHYDRLERSVCESSDAVVFITPDFLTAASQMGFHPARNYVIENWAPLDDLPPVAKRNSWSKRHGLADKLVFLYSGTLGLKHKPELLYEMAAALEDRSDALVVVVSEGLGRSWLERKLQEAPLKNLLLMDFQPYAAMPEVLGAADVLLAVIEKEAGVFAVPSKVLSYFCAGRPVLLAAPEANLAARTLRRAQAGMAVDPGDTGSFIDAARRLAANPEMRLALADNARRYATTTFDIKSIAARFDAILREAVDGLALPAQTFDPAYSRAATD
ncbi:MAG TPA: glycosyltransferase family 4 protein [Bryobacteraceae bacterium]|nr:glycosyltransferase family 4 protein [Bryobacteraceae bacterium]